MAEAGHGHVRRDPLEARPWRPRRRTARQPRHGARHLRRLHPERRAVRRRPARRPKRQLERADKLGYIWNAGPELEFFLFRKDEDGEIKPLPARQRRLLRLLDRPGANIRQDMVNALEAFGISVEAAHHEVAAGQHEIDFRYADGLKTADNAVTFKFTLKAIAQLHGLYATFMPKPIFGINGSGMHTHQCLYSIARGAQRVRRPGQQVRAVGPGAQLHGRHPDARPRHDRGARAAGELVQAAGARLRGADLPDLGPDQPLGAHPRPQGLARHRIEATRVEVRCPDPSSNTYLAFACMLAAGLDGVEKGIELADPVEESLYAMTPERIKEHGIQELPGTLGEALDELEQDEVIRDALGDHVCRTTSRPSARSGTSTAPRSPSGRSTATSKRSLSPCSGAVPDWATAACLQARSGGSLLLAMPVGT